MFQKLIASIKNAKTTTIILAVVVMASIILVAVLAFVNGGKTQKDQVDNDSNDDMTDTIVTADTSEETDVEPIVETTDDLSETTDIQVIDILYDSGTLLRYQIDDTILDDAFMTYNFKTDYVGQLYAQGYFDLNQDGLYEETDWFIMNEPVMVRQDYANRFSFALPDIMKQIDPETEFKVVLMLTDNVMTSPSEIEAIMAYEVTLEIITEVIDSEFGLDVEGANEELKRGAGINYPILEMDFEPYGYNTDYLPDLFGGKMDCFAISTANNLINMTSQHDRQGDLPDSPEELIEILKRYMNYNNGIYINDFEAGKNAFCRDYNLPIRTEVIEQPDIDDLGDAFAGADGIEISLKMIRSASGKPATGHVVTGVSAYQDGDDAGLAVHDNATPTGVDIFDINMSGGDPFIYFNYPLWDGIVIVDYICLQYWDESIVYTDDGSGIAPPEDESEEPTEEETEDEDGSTEEDDPGTTEEPEETTDDGDTSTGEDDSAWVPGEAFLELAFDHVKPGEYSEVYAAVTGLMPGDEVEAKMSGGGQNNVSMIVEVDSNGLAYFTWKIYSYDTYNVTVTLPDGSTKQASIVVN